MIIHRVESGDTLFNLAKKYGTNVDAMVNLNGILRPANLAVGQTVIVPGFEGNSYNIVKGDTLYNIARRNNISLRNLLSANPQISNPNMINIGQEITIPGYKPTIEVNGYAIANINKDVLFMTLQYLTYLSIFSYQIKEDGSLTRLFEEELVDMARNQNVAPLMVVTNIGESGSFESDLAHTILRNPSVQQTLIDNIIAIANKKNYFGVDIDFEFLYPEDRDFYTAFLKNLKTQLQANGKKLSVAVAPKYSDDQAGLLYEAHDYGAIGQIADRVIIMTYEWGYVFGEPQAIAPYNQVERVISYAVTKIPSQKILMGMSNYAYDWTLPFVEGSSARTLTNQSALELAIDKGATILFDNDAQAPFFNYVDESGRKHIVWFDDALSTRARLGLVTKYDLAGVSYWTINNFWTQNWKVLDSIFTIKKVI